MKKEEKDKQNKSKEENKTVFFGMSSSSSSDKMEGEISGAFKRAVIWSIIFLIIGLLISGC